MNDLESSAADSPEKGAVGVPLEDEAKQLAAQQEADALAQAKAAEEAEAAAVRAARLKKLMQRIASHADFASMRDSIQGIQRVARSDKSHVRALTAEIAEDVAMTGKLLRLVNAAFYSSVGGGNITSMKRAVDLMGFQSIGMLASSLVLFEKLPKNSDGDRLRQEFGRAQFAAMLAHEMCNSSKHIDGAYMTALFQNLGEMLGGMHFAEEIREIEEQLDACGLAHEDPERLQAKNRLARQYWGISIQEIGVEVAQQWGWPENLRVSMRSLHPTDNQRAASQEEYLRVLCTAANRLAGDVLRLPATGTAEERAEARKLCVERFAAEMAIPLGIMAESVVDTVERTKVTWDDLAQALGFGPAAGSAKAVQTSKPADSVKTATAPTAAVTPRPQARSAVGAPAVADALGLALEQISELALSGAPRGRMLQLCMKTMHEVLQLQRVILCLRDTQSDLLQGKLGLGDRITELAPLFTIPLQPPGDLFGLLCLKNADTLISDIADPVISKRLPAWYREARAQTFVFLPMVKGKQVMGALYGDQAKAGRLVLSDQEMSLLKTLRDQVVLTMN